MLLKNLLMVNFRQFNGENLIEFATDPENNITLIHGENGVGKTTILNAILWCLFEKHTADFERPEELVCKQAIADGHNSCRIELEFEYEDKEYHAIRAKGGATGDRFKVHEVDDGNYKEVPSSKSFINSILPADMAEYFFFHGEGISHISSGKSGNKFRTAIRDILGFTFAEAAIDDLHHVNTKFTKELRKLSKGAEQIEKAFRDKEILEKDYLHLESELKKTRAEFNDLDGQYEEVRTAIEESGHQDASRIQAAIRKAEVELHGIKTSLDSCKTEKQALIQKYGWCILGHKLSSEGLEFIDEASLKGRVPAPYDQSLVNDLVERGSCICGRKLAEGSEPYKLVLSLLETANTASITQRLHRARSVGDKMKGLANEFLQEVNKLEKRIESEHRKLGEKENDLVQFNKDLESIKVENIEHLRKKKDSLKDRRDRVLRMQIKYDGDLKATKIRLADVTKLCNQESGGNARLQKLMENQAKISTMIEHCAAKLESYEAGAKSRIGSSVNKILSDFSRKDYTVKLSSDFDFHLVRRDGQIVAKSKGENLLLNLSFVSALIEMAEARAGASGEFLVSGTVAPFVIDAPFGELDDTYKAATASFLPTHTKQLVLLLSSSHWKGTVESTIIDKIGSEYILISNKTTEQGNKPLDEIEINNTTYQLSKYEQAKESTSLERIV